MHAAQGLDFRRPLKSSERIEKIHAEFRKEVPFLLEDRYLSRDMKLARNFGLKNW
jgi:histidine ammonia-lyase